MFPNGNIFSFRYTFWDIIARRHSIYKTRPDPFLFTVLGIRCLGLNGVPVFSQSEAVSFQVATVEQAGMDRYWNAIIGHRGQESQCGWSEDRWGLSWQITLRTLSEAMAAGGEDAERAFAAVMTITKIDVAAIQAARRG